MVTCTLLLNPVSVPSGRCDCCGLHFTDGAQTAYVCDAGDFCFWWYWRLKSGPHSCEANSLLLGHAPVLLPF
jgi:hypothetical protein